MAFDKKNNMRSYEFLSSPYSHGRLKQAYGHLFMEQTSHNRDTSFKVVHTFSIFSSNVNPHGILGML